MAEAVVFSLASKILSATASPAFKMVYEKGVSIWEARNELVKLQVSVETILAVLLDAEKKQEGSASVKNWIKRLKGVLYDAEDLFDEVATENLVRQQLMEGKEKVSLMKKVHVSCFKLNPIVSRNSIAKKVKAIRKDLVEISKDMAQFQFVRCPDEKLIFDMGLGENRGCFVDAKFVIGRDEDKKNILEKLINKSDNYEVLAIIGIGGMGKTTLAQLIYSDEEIGNTFEHRWFACISNTSDEREVLRKIFESMGKSGSDLDVGQLQTKIRESIKDNKFLLILDDVWEDDHTRWQDRMNLLNNCSTDSRIIVTTRSPSVGKAMGALRFHHLEGLSKDDSWSLFKSSAFVEEYDNDPRRESLGKEILKKCSGVPLAIRSIGSLLYLKNTIEEWEVIEKEDLPVLGRKYNDKTMSVLKLSYDHLPSHLKHCFAYCSLFPKDYVFSKKELVNHWIAQGYIDPNDEDSCFMHLLRRGFFQEAEELEFGGIKTCKMHDLMHDLAIHVAGEESVVLSNTSSNTSCCLRHVTFEISSDEELLDISALVLSAKSLRSLILTKPSRHPIERSTLEQLFASFKLLRTLNLSKLRINDIPPSIGELKLMRHLDLSHNLFEELPHSVSNLVNLLSLDLKSCKNFKVWPLNFHKLSNLRYMNIQQCHALWLMPTGIGKMTNLRYLENFKTGKGDECLNSVATLLQQLRGKLSITVWGDMEGEVERDDCNWKLPVSLYQLDIIGYQGVRIPSWVDRGRANNLARLKLSGCRNVKYLPSLRCLPNLRSLVLEQLSGLEFMEEEEEDGSMFFPCLEKLLLEGLVNLKRWWRNIPSRVTFVEFPRLRQLSIRDCSRLEFPLTLSNPYRVHPTLKSLQMASPRLKKMHVEYCNDLLSIELVVPQDLTEVSISECKELKSIELVEAHTPMPSLGTLDIYKCAELESLSASARIIAGFKLIEITGCPKVRLVELLLPSPDALNNLGGCSWSVEAIKMDDIELIQLLSWLPIQDVHIVWCTMPIRFPAAPFTSLQRLQIEDVDGLENLQLDGSPLLQEVYIWDCASLTSVEVEAPFCVMISRCPALKNLQIANPNALEKFSIEECPKLGRRYKDIFMRTRTLAPIREPAALKSSLLRMLQESSIKVQRTSEEGVLEFKEDLEKH